MGEREALRPTEGPVLVTGFGPFHHHVVNASWVAVQELQRLGVEQNSQPVPLVTREIPVVYDVVSEGIPKLHEEVKPRLCVHVGVSPYKGVKMERIARNRPYLMADVHGRAPSGFKCVQGGPECIQTRFSLERVCEKVSRKQTDVDFGVSSDAGRYLCDFIYYTSLHVSSAPVLFVHVPELNKPYTAEQLGLALKAIVEALLEEMASEAQ